MEILPSAFLDPLTVTNEPCKLHLVCTGAAFWGPTVLRVKAERGQLRRREGVKKLKEAQCLQKAPVGSSTEADPARSRGVPEPWRSLNNLCINRTAVSKIHTVMCVAMQPHLKLQGIRLYRSSGETEMISSLTSDPTKAEVP